MRLLVCGGRTYFDTDRLNTGIGLIHSIFGITEIIQGGANGADWIAKQWAKETCIPCTEVPANWKVYGRAAGMIRNKAMLALKPDAVLAAPGGPGTANMCSLAAAAGVPLYYLEDLFK